MCTCFDFVVVMCVGVFVFILKRIVVCKMFEKKYCSICDISFYDIEPHNFSFNSPIGACSDCNGLGSSLSINPIRIVPDINKNLADGCIEPLGPQPASDSYQSKVRINNRKISKSGLENSSTKLFPKGTILVSIFASIGMESFINTPILRTGPFTAVRGIMTVVSASTSTTLRLTC